MAQFIYSSGGIGDQIYSLPVVKALGGGIFVSGLDRPRYEYSKPLLESQSYIKEVRHVSETDLPKGFINLDWFRTLWDNKTHIVNLQLRYFGFPDYDFSKGGWLETDKLPDINEDMRFEKPYSIINITPRYRDRFFNWHDEVQMIHQLYKGEKIFYLGVKEDYDQCAFIKKGYGPVEEHRVRFLKSSNALHAASIIRSAEMFSGNQSLMLAIRQSLGLPYRFEQAPFHVDTTQHSAHEIILNPLSRRLHKFCYGIKSALK